MHVLSDPIAQLLGPWAAEPGPWCAVFRVALAVLLAAVIGWERSSKRHSAGLRTFMLISLAGCAAALLDQSLLDANIPLLSAAAIIGMAILELQFHPLQLQKPDQGPHHLGGPLGLRFGRCGARQRGLCAGAGGVCGLAADGVVVPAARKIPQRPFQSL